MQSVSWTGKVCGLNWTKVLPGGGLVAGDEITLTNDLELTKPVEAVVPAQYELTPAA